MFQSLIVLGLNRNLSSRLATRDGSSGKSSFQPVRQKSWHGNVLKTDYRLVTDPKYNKGLGYTYEERQRLNMIGLLPNAYRSVDEQLHAVYENFKSKKTNFDRYLYVRALRARQERLYYHFLMEKIDETMPIVYTPTVGAACQAFSSIYFLSSGLYVSKYDKGHMAEVLANWPESDIQAVCVTDGGRILGLGDLGANGMGISIGKIDLYTALAKIPPVYLLPAVLDVGTNNIQLLCDPTYIGVREERCTGPEYEELVQEFVDAVVECWGYRTLIHFEDFATPNAFKFIKKYQHKYCHFNDDVQGTAACVVAGFLAAEHITKVPLEEQVFLFVGAGSAGVGSANLLVQQLLSRQLSKEDALKNIYVTDMEGIVTKDRKAFSLPEVKKFAKDMPPETNLEKLVDTIKPSIILGATGQGGLFTEKILRSMASNHQRPVIFACSNPTNKSECTAEQAYNYTEGRALFASGSPFPPVVVNGKRLTPRQANNAFSFPGIALGILSMKPLTIPDEIYLVAAQAIANFSIDNAPDGEELYPSIKEAPNLAFAVAKAVAQHIVESGEANVYPVPCDIERYLKSYQYYTDLESVIPSVWEYPPQTKLPLPALARNNTCPKGTPPAGKTRNCSRCSGF